MEIIKLHPLERLPDHFKDHDNWPTPLDLPPVAPDQFIDGYEATRWEVWSYYIMYVANSGLGPYYFAPTALQNLLSRAAGDTGLLRFAGRPRNVNSIVLLSNGISCAIQAVIFLLLGSYADFGTWRPWILIVQSAIGIAIGFGWLGVATPDKWVCAAALYIVGLIVYQLSYAYWLAAFPSLARNTPTMREHAEKYNSGEISREEYDFVDSMKRNEICNTALCIDGIGEVPLIAIGIGILYGVHSNESVANNSWGLSVFIAWTSAFWLVLAIPWFVLEKRRPGQPLPPRKTYVAAGLWQIYRAAIHIWRLKQSLAYLIGFFFLSDSLNTTIVVIGTLQSEVQEYNTIEICELYMVLFATQAAGILAFMYVQRRWNLTTKTMLNACAVSIIAIDIYGMAGIWTETIGFHHRWEFWVYNVWYGFMICPWYAYSQTMISEVTPRGKDFLFFSLFNIAGKASSFVGPVICSAVIDAVPSHNNSTSFYFLTAVSIASFGVVLFFVDLKTSRKEQEDFLNDERRARLELQSQIIGARDP